MREISFTKVSPTRNITVLVESEVPQAQQAALAARLLADDGVGGEQAGFLERPVQPGADLRLRMMGGEFCGNAAMSAGAFLAWTTGAQQAEYLLEVSGADGLVPCSVRREGDGYSGTVRMPLPEGFDRIRLETDSGERLLPMVRMPGIAHLIVPADDALSRSEIERRIRGWNGSVGADALGVLRWDEAAQAIEPLVYVPATDSAVWEQGCGSGTAALGCWLAMQAGRAMDETIRQPGGEIRVHAEVAQGKIAALTITGTVRFIARGTAFVQD